jgi:biotin transport system substrate-specific component
MLLNNKSNLAVINIAASILSSSIFWIISFTVLTAISAQISIPAKPVPFTLQTLMVVLSGALLGSKNGAYSQFLYLFLGAVGLPVFAATPEGAIGFARLFGPTGGYLLAFPIAAFITGVILEKRNNYFMVASAMLAGNLIVILFGVLYLNVFFVKDINQSLALGAAIFSVWTIVKVIAATVIYFSVKNSFKKLKS